MTSPDPRAPVVLAMVAERLGRIDPRWAQAPVTGSLLRGPGSTGILLRPNHTESPGHLDLDFVLNVDRPVETTVSDCATGIARTPEDAWSQAVDTWCQLTASTAIEVLAPSGRLAGHQHGDDATGFPGWHMVSAGWVGFGLDDPALLSRWAADNAPLAAIAPVVARHLDRPALNGVKLLFGGDVDEQVTEVRINGVACAEAADALLALPWPRPARSVFTKGFALLVHPEDAPCG